MFNYSILYSIHLNNLIEDICLYSYSFVIIIILVSVHVYIVLTLI